MNRTSLIILIISIVAGIVIAWTDSQPHWDDTGISVFMILATSTLCGFLSGKKPWLIALAIGIWIPLASIFYTHVYGGIIAIVPAFIGAYSGSYVKNKLLNR